MTAPVVSIDTMTMAATVQKPDRVSIVLRSSVVTMRLSGMRWCVTGRERRSWWSCEGSFA